ncbi:MAG: putative type II secretion system protein F [Chlamydiae bacterium]|nr:putative type II secretion system protein F [Chlamydiota bacterium]
MQFEYLALSIDGKKIKGFVLAETLMQAQEKLLEDDLVVLKITSSKKARHLHLKAEEKLQWAKLFLQLLQAGIPVYESMQMLKEQGNAKRLFLQDSLLEKLKAGKRLSEAMSEYPNCFDYIFVTTIKAAESSGKLEKAIETYIEFLEKQLKLKKQLISLLLYPTVILCFSLSALLLLLIVAIPSLQDLVQEESLNLLSKSVFALSSFLRHDYPILIVVLLSGFVMSTIIIKKKGLYPFLFKMPLVKTLLFQRDLFYFSKSAANLLENHVSLFETLQLSRGLLKHAGLKKLFLTVEAQVMEGKHISESLKDSALISPTLVQMLKIGEESASLHQSFSNIANMFEENMEKKLMRLMALLQPALIIFLGLFVGLIILSILMPLTNVSLDV